MTKLVSLNKIKCDLGEGCQISTCGQNLAWVDIIKQQVFIYNINAQTNQVFDLTSVPSAIFSFVGDKVTLLDDAGIIILCITDGSVTRDVLVNELDNNILLRGNDGVLCDGVFYFGTMQFSPEPNTGQLYKVANKQVEPFGSIGIPNTFIPTQSGILISDSLTQIIYLYTYDTLHKTLWCDLSQTNMVPDGGCIGPNGNIFICMWGAGLVAELDDAGKIITTHPVPVKNPTNCLTVSDRLFVTSASVETTQAELVKYPLSGHTFFLEI